MGFSDLLESSERGKRRDSVLCSETVAVPGTFSFGTGDHYTVLPSWSGVVFQSRIRSSAGEMDHQKLLSSSLPEGQIIS